ncbi:MAG: hypothetical protein K2X47_04750, partial [Bdellovibrionales bacterium]|nr:hypothetical protein [Bdellovibrionales bacterium]
MRLQFLALSVTVATATPTSFVNSADSAPVTAPAYCAPPKENVLTETQTTLKQNFFFRTFPNGKRVIFAAAEGGKRRFLNPLKAVTLDQGAHFQLDLETGETTKLSESDMDPVNIGEDIVTSPSVRWGLRFFHLSDLLKGKGESKASLAHDSKMSGEYQSVGVLKPDNPQIVRVMISSTQQTANFRDYEIDRSRPRPEITPLGDAPSGVCTNLDRGQFRTPMISKDGRYVSYLKWNSGHTFIAKIHEKSGTCEDVVELPVG